MAAVAGLAALTAGLPSRTAAQEDPPDTPVPASGRQWLVPVPVGCKVPALPDVVFVGTLLETGTPAGAPEVAEVETARYQVDQVRVGSVDSYSYGGVIDVRYGVDTKYLDDGDQYLVGASLDAESAVLVSKVREAEPQFGGDEVIGAAESDVKCPVLDDPVRTLNVDGTSIEAGVLSPLGNAKRGLLRALLLPLVAAVAIVFVLAMIRWLFTGVFKGLGAVAHTAGQTREVRAATRSRPRVREE